MYILANLMIQLLRHRKWDMKLFLLMILSSFLVSLFAVEMKLPSLSEKRLPDETMEQAYQRNFGHHEKKFFWPSSPTPYSTKTDFLSLASDQVPVWKDKKSLEFAFRMVRDKRFLIHSSNKKFERRLTWLYPDDGCYARAEMMSELLTKAGYERPYKIFIFGNLHADTDNTPDGYVEWWYHVAPIVKVDSVVYVFDPSLDYYRPLPLVEWVKRIDSSFNGEFSTHDYDLKFAICDEFSYSPDESCMREDLSAKPSYSSDALRSLQTFLPYEWSRQTILNRNPKDVLGDKPLWLNN